MQEITHAKASGMTPLVVFRFVGQGDNQAYVKFSLELQLPMNFIECVSHEN